MLFAFTSPRTLEKIIPEIDLLIKMNDSQSWDKKHQIDFYKALVQCPFFEKTHSPNASKLTDGMQARDRINRAPRALGFVELKPVVKLTEAGYDLINGINVQETILRQLLKFQLPSPNHTQSSNVTFNIKPYLELLRLIYDLGSISKFEVAAFFSTMIDYKDYESVKNDILDFRKECSAKRGTVNIKELKDEKHTQIISRIWRAEIEKGQTATRESSDNSVKKFIETKKSNTKDYADAFFRYLHASGLVSLEKGTYHFIISKTKKEEVEYILNNTDRNPIVFDNNLEFYRYLGARNNVKLLTDDIEYVKKKLLKLGESYSDKSPLEELQLKLDEAYKNVKIRKENEDKAKLLDYSDYEDIISTYDKIKKGDIIDAPLMLEYNTWRSMTMVDHAIDVKGNYVTDAECMPISTAGGGVADIEIKYENFGLILEVTMARGSKQYDMEGEPVARHYGKAKKTINEDMYCIFIAPKLNIDCVAHFFNTNRFNTRVYGGKTKIIPMSIDDFVNFISSTKKNKISSSLQIKNFLEEMWKIGQDSNIDEVTWQNRISNSVLNWSLT